MFLFLIWKNKKLPKPIITSINKYIQDVEHPLIALYANKKYNNECIGLKSFHHIFSPKTSAPFFLEPDK